MSTIIGGIDPGKDGGYAELCLDGKLRFAMTLEQGLNYLLGLPHGSLANRFIWCERAQVMHINGKKQSSTSSFTYGTGYGEILGILRALNLRHQLVRPADWTRVIHAGTKDSDVPKARSLEAAQRLFPGETWLIDKRRKPHDGLFEAALIAEYGRRMLSLGTLFPPRLIEENLERHKSGDQQQHADHQAVGEKL